MQRSEQINELAKAMAAAQGQFDHAAKDATNPHFQKKYADIASVIDVIRKPLADNGLCVMQPMKVVDGGVEVETWVMHESGQWCMETTFMPAPSNANPQQLGSATTYARRYGLNGMFVLGAEDDDGNAASEAAPAAKKATKDKKVPSERIAELITQGDEHAKQGYDPFLAWWQGLSNDERLSIHISHVNEWKKMTREALSSKEPEHDPETGEIKES